MANKPSIQSIPITVIGAPPVQRYHWRRRLVQLLFIAIALLIPISGLLRIDLVAGAFVVLDRQIWWSDFFLVFGLWMVIASGLVLLYSTLGTAFCGWACPQNTLSELANHWTYRLLGKRADLSVSGEKMKVAAQKNRLVNWLLLGALLLVTSMVTALIPLFYFYPPSVVWSFVTLQEDVRLASSLHYIYSIFVLVIFVDIGFIRHFWCRFMCIYKVWQHGFKTRQTLHLEYDAQRADECLKCNYCNTVCFLGLDPRRTDIYDTCINCGECIDACNTVQAKKGAPGLLTFKRGARKSGTLATVSSYVVNLSSRVQWTIPFGVIGLAMFVWGIISYQPYHLAVYRADREHGAEIQDYRIAISNKRYRPAELELSIDGLATQDYALESHTALLDTAGRVDLNLHIKEQLPAGLHAFLVRVQASDGWTRSYRVQHFVASQ